MSNRKRPNFLMVGTAKAGTSSIAKYLDAHPQVFIPEAKEPRYFLHDVFKTVSHQDPMFNYLMESSMLNWDDYLNLYQNTDATVTALGDASVQYLYHYDTVIPQVKEKLGDIPIIIVLRDPIKRAFSNYKYQSSMECLNFSEALDEEEKRKNQRFNSFWFYKEMGLYFNQVDAYQQAFSRVHICLYDDLMQDPEHFMLQIYNFLHLNDAPKHDFTQRYNETIVAKNRLLQYLNYYRNQYGVSLNFLPKKYKTVLKNFFFHKNIEKISPKEKALLLPFFTEDIKKLESLIDRDLSSWYSDVS